MTSKNQIPGGHNLFVPDSEVSRKIENLYNRFKVALVKRDEASRNRVVQVTRFRTFVFF